MENTGTSASWNCSNRRLCGGPGRNVYFSSQDKKDEICGRDTLDFHSSAYIILQYIQQVGEKRNERVALEVNNSSLLKPHRRLNCVENYHTMLKLCQKYGTNIIVSSDAHDPAWVGEWGKALQLLEKVGFDEELIVNNSEEKLKAFLGCR